MDINKKIDGLFFTLVLTLVSSLFLCLGYITILFDYALPFNF